MSSHVPAPPAAPPADTEGPSPLLRWGVRVTLFTLAGAFGAVAILLIVRAGA